MRRLLLPLVALSLAVILVAVFAWRRVGSKEASVVLADGTIVTLEAVTLGTNHVVGSEPPYLVELRGRVPSFMVGLLGRPRLNLQRSSTKNRGFLWFTQWDPVRNRYIGPAGISDVEVWVEGGRFCRLGRSSSSSNSKGGVPYKQVYADVLPRRSDVFEVRFKVMGQSYRLSAANPWAGRLFPAWQPETLPRHHSVQGFEFTLRAVRRQSWGGREFRYVPDWEIRRGDQGVEDWWDADVQYSDPSGNQSSSWLPDTERVGRLEARFFRSARYPFAAAEIRRLGSLELPQAGEYLALELGDELRRMGLDTVALVGAGVYAIKDGELQSAGPPDGRKGCGWGSSAGSKSWELNLHGDRPQIMFVSCGSARLPDLLDHQDLRRPLLRVKRQDGEWRKARWSGSSTSGDGNLRTIMHLFELPEHFNGGLVELELIHDVALVWAMTVGLPSAESDGE